MMTSTPKSEKCGQGKLQITKNSTFYSLEFIEILLLDRIKGFDDFYKEFFKGIC